MGSGMQHRRSPRGREINTDEAVAGCEIQELLWSVQNKDAALLGGSAVSS